MNTKKAILVALLAALAMIAGLTANQQRFDAQAQEKPVGEKKGAADRFGDPLPAGAIARLGSVRLRHGERIWSLAVSPDGRTIASGSGSFGRQESVLRLWDVATGKELRSIEVADRRSSIDVLSLAFSPDGATLAAGVSFICLIDPATGKVLRRCFGHKAGVTAVAFSRDGKTLASASYDQTVRLWDAATGKGTQKCVGHQGAVYSVAFTVDGNSLVSGGEDKTIRLWDCSTGKEQRRWLAHEKSVTALTFLPDGKKLASASSDKSLRLWDFNTAKELRKFLGHEDAVSSLALAPDGKTLASGGRDQTIRFWDLATGNEIRRYKGGSVAANSLAFAQNGKLLVAGSTVNGIWLWETATGKELHGDLGCKGWVMGLTFSPDGTAIASAAVDGTARIWDAWTGKERAVLARDQGLGWTRNLFFTPDGKKIVASGYRQGCWFRRIADGKIVHQFGKSEEGFNALAQSPDGAMVASAGPDKVIRLWESATGKELRSFTWNTTYFGALAFSPDGALLASGGSDKDETITLWDLKAGKQLHRLKGHTSSVMSLVFSTDGKTLLSASTDIRRWDLATGKELWRWTETGGSGGLGGSLALSRDGRFFIAACQNNKAYLFEMATGKEIKQFAGHLGDVLAVAFAPHGRTIASGGMDSTALVWDVTGRLQNGKLPIVRLENKELESFWGLLGDLEPRAAHQALWALVAADRQAVRFLQDRLLPVPKVDEARVQQLLTQLEDARFPVREKATKELEILGDGTGPLLRKALAKQVDLEPRRRLERLLAKLDPLSPESLRRARAVAVLEYIGAPEARKVLQALARGAPQARLTKEAQAAVRRLARD